MIYKFERLIKKYGVKDATTLTTSESEGYWDDNTGLWVPPFVVEDPVPIHGAIVPMSTKVINDSGGRYTTNDRHFYTRTKCKSKQHITYRDVTYSVEEETDYTEYGDFYLYTLRAVSSFAED